MIGNSLGLSTASKTPNLGMLQTAYADHGLGLDAPDFQPQAAEDVERMESNGCGFLKFRQGAIKLRQAIEGDAMVQMMDVMIADIGREPCHQRAGFEMAAGFKRGFFIGPTGIVLV